MRSVGVYVCIWRRIVTSCSTGRFSAIVALTFCCSGQAFGQLQATDLARLGVPGFESLLPGSGGYYGPPQKWDYRFDPQFQSTVKPYLRWYMRYDPTMPGNRVLPRDFNSVRYGYDVHGAGGGYNRPSLYWNHLRYLRDAYGHTRIER